MFDKFFTNIIYFLIVKKYNTYCHVGGIPMIIIITGATHTGKTLAAQRLIEKLKYPFIRGGEEL